MISTENMPKEVISAYPHRAFFSMVNLSGLDKILLLWYGTYMTYSSEGSIRLDMIEKSSKVLLNQPFLFSSFFTQVVASRGPATGSGP